MNTMLFPVSLKKSRDDGDPYWFAEQKQLNVCASEYGMEDCLDSIRGKIQAAFREMGCTADKFARLQLDLVAAKAEIVVDIKKTHRTLDEFTAVSIESEDSDDEIPGLLELEGDPDFEEAILSGRDTAPLDDAMKTCCDGDRLKCGAPIEVPELQEGIIDG